MILSITKADYLGNYKINLSFSDGLVRIVDFGDFLKNARNPMTSKYLDETIFQKFKVSCGDLIWNDYELCFPIHCLYSGKL